VLDGTATLVTGGRAVNANTTAPQEIRGSTIEEGQARRVGKGDLVVVPSGVPHLFKDVKGPFVYYVVKVTSPRRSS
jgi:mannose-6-phosphate isomerase-like protein (cupin superfamily)